MAHVDPTGAAVADASGVPLEASEDAVSARVVGEVAEVHVRYGEIRGDRLDLLRDGTEGAPDFLAELVQVQERNRAVSHRLVVGYCDSAQVTLARELDNVVGRESAQLGCLHGDQKGTIAPIVTGVEAVAASSARRQASWSE